MFRKQKRNTLFEIIPTPAHSGLFMVWVGKSPGCLVISFVPYFSHQSSPKRPQHCKHQPSFQSHSPPQDLVLSVLSPVMTSSCMRSSGQLQLSFFNVCTLPGTFYNTHFLGDFGMADHVSGGSCKYSAEISKAMCLLGKGGDGSTACA